MACKALASNFYQKHPASPRNNGMHPNGLMRVATVILLT